MDFISLFNLYIFSSLCLAFDNNPGWFILEDESADIGNMGILRRNLPLLANKVPLIMVEAKYAVCLFSFAKLWRCA